MKSNFIRLVVVAAIGLGATYASGCAKKDKQDCFTCNTGGESVNFCYTEGNDFYTMTIDGDVQEIPTNGRSWSSIKSDKQAVCDQN